MEMHDRFLVLDAHSDMLNDVLPKHVLGRRNVIDKDWLPGMKRGGIDTRVVAIYSDITYVPEMALRRALDLVSVLHEEINQSSSLALCITSDDIKQAKDNGKIGFILGMEGAEPLGRDIRLLRIFYIVGLRVLGLTHTLRNYAGDPAFISPTITGKTGGISDFGLELVQEANKLGIVIDVSHLNDPGFWDVIENTKAPIIASHSNCRSLFDHPRCLSDSQIKAIEKTNGVIGINAAAILVNGREDATLSQLLDHLDHMVNVGGVKSVGLGFDFCDYLLEYSSEDERARLPYIGPVQGLSGDTDVPKIADCLCKRGYSEEDIELILGKNFLRVFEDVLKSNHGRSTPCYKD